VANPLLWLSLSVLLVAIGLTAVVVAALPALQELARAARSAEKLLDMLNRELPPTLEAIRLTGTELSSLSDDVSQNVQAAGRVVGQFDQGLVSLKQQAKQAQTTTRSFLTGVRAAWQTFNQSNAAPSEDLEDLEDLDDLEYDEIEADDQDDQADIEAVAPAALAPAPSTPFNLKPEIDSSPAFSSAAAESLQPETRDLT
jgi:uncharacterized protein YoxC